MDTERWILRAICGLAVAVVGACSQPESVEQAPQPAASETTAATAPGPAAAMVPETDANEAVFGLTAPSERWTINNSEPGGARIWSNIAGAVYSFSASGPVNIHFLKHDWSGIALILVDGAEIAELDLYAETPVTDFEYTVDTPAGQSSTVDIVVSGRKNPLSQDAQVWVYGVRSE